MICLPIATLVRNEPVSLVHLKSVADTQQDADFCRYFGGRTPARRGISAKPCWSKIDGSNLVPPPMTNKYCNLFPLLYPGVCDWPSSSYSPGSWDLGSTLMSRHETIQATPLDFSAPIDTVCCCPTAWHLVGARLSVPEPEPWRYLDVQ